MLPKDFEPELLTRIRPWVNNAIGSWGKNERFTWLLTVQTQQADPNLPPVILPTIVVWLPGALVGGPPIVTQFHVTNPVGVLEADVDKTVRNLCTMMLDRRAEDMNTLGN